MVIFLNGVSSSGKTSIAKELLKLLNEKYLYLGLDEYLRSVLPLNLDLDSDEGVKAYDQAASAFNQALKSYSESYEFIIVDHVLEVRSWIKEVSTSLKNAKVLFVKVTAPMEIIEERERSRPDRMPGSASLQANAVNSYRYDLIINTAELSPVEAASRIISNLKAGYALHESAAD